MNVQNMQSVSRWPCLTAARVVLLVLAACVFLSQARASAAEPAREQRIIGPHREHVRELARYLDHVEIYAPIRYRHLALFPVRLRDGDTLRGNWLTMDEAMSRGVLAVREKGGGSVPVVIVQNRSRHETVFIMGGEVLAGGKQTRTVRQDVVLSPGQRVELRVFCVEAQRWKGDSRFNAGETLLPQSIQKALRKGADQEQVWSEVARNNRALAAETVTGSLEAALNSPSVKRRLGEVRARIVPETPKDSVGFIFLSGRRAVGADFFGRADVARGLLPKLLDSYSVDCILQHGGEAVADEKAQESSALAFFDQVRKAGSERVATSGSGAGIATNTRTLLGGGVSLGEVLVHYGVQIRDRITPPPPSPLIRPQIRR